MQTRTVRMTENIQDTRISQSSDPTFLTIPSRVARRRARANDARAVNTMLVITVWAPLGLGPVGLIVLDIVGKANVTKKKVVKRNGINV